MQLIFHISVHFHVKGFFSMYDFDILISLKFTHSDSVYIYNTTVFQLVYSVFHFSKLLSKFVYNVIADITLLHFLMLLKNVISIFLTPKFNMSHLTQY